MAKKSIYTKKLGGTVAGNAKGSRRSKFHVVASQSGKWAIVSEGTVSPVRAFYSQQYAVSFAKQYAIAQSVVEVVVHGKDGSTEKRISI